MTKQKKYSSTKLTLTEIAREAGVSTATVSRVVNGKGYVSKALRECVQKVIDARGYQPLRVHKKDLDTPWVAVLTDQLINPFFAQILAAVQEQALKSGLSALVLQMVRSDDRRVEQLEHLGQHAWAGIIAAGFYMQRHEWIKLQEKLRVPFVIFNSDIKHPTIATLRVNFERAAIAAIKHLLDLGHTRIAYMGDATDEFSKAELRGVEIALQESGLDYRVEYRISTPHTAEGATQAVHQLMMLAPNLRPTAVVTFDDEFGIHVLSALNYYGLHIPQDISVVGFDNIPMAAHTNPPLTTIDVPKYRIGQQMIVLLQQLIKNHGKIPVGQVILDGSLLVRGSTGPVRKVSPYTGEIDT